MSTRELKAKRILKDVLGETKATKVARTLYGFYATRGEFPWMAFIVIQKGTDKESLVSSNPKTGAPAKMSMCLAYYSLLLCKGVCP